MMSDADILLAFVRSAKAKGADDPSIERMLRNEGWSDRKISTALVTYERERLDLEIPSRGGRSEGAREAFFYLLSFALLGTWAIALVWLGDKVIDRAFPSALDYTNYFTYTVRDMAGQMASVIIAFPLYLLVNYLLGREIAQRPEARDSGVRKWLTYIALVLAAGTLVGDATWFLTTFLTGDLSTRFIAKSLLLLVLAGGIFWYYLVTIRPEFAWPAFTRMFATGALILVVVFVGLGFSTVGTPRYERDLRADEQRTGDLGLIALAVDDYYHQRGHLPASLRTQGMLGMARVDPARRYIYGYRTAGKSAYYLCATFDAAGTDPNDSLWNHPAGYHCFGRSV